MIIDWRLGTPRVFLCSIFFARSNRLRVAAGRDDIREGATEVFNALRETRKSILRYTPRRSGKFTRGISSLIEQK